MGQYQLKIAFAYILIIASILVLLNTYPVWVSQSSVFRYKHTSMMQQASLVASVLSDMTQEDVGRVMDVVDDRDVYHTIVCDEKGLVLYDNALNNNAVGKFAVFQEISDALSGDDVFRSIYETSAFKSRLAVPVVISGQIVGAVYLYEYDAVQAASLDGLRSNLSVVTVGITAVSVILSIFMSVALTRRISGILWAIRAVRDGDYGYKTDVHGKDELAQVAGQFNELSEILEKTEKLRQQFVSDASHELKTPLASIRLLTDSILQTEDMDAKTVREFVTDIGDEIDRLGRVTERLMLLTRVESEELQKPVVFNPAKPIERASHMLKPLAEKAGVTVRPELSEGLTAFGDEDDFYEVVFNLVENAVKYNNPGGEVKVIAFNRENKLIFIVCDTGAGIGQEDLPKVFERFYRVDKARSREAGGTGLGLAIVRHTVMRMGGEVRIESELGKGTAVTVEIPAEENRV